MYIIKLVTDKIKGLYNIPVRLIQNLLFKFTRKRNLALRAQSIDT
jgi:hypothetical protein